MRSYISSYCVRVVAKMIDVAYAANCDGQRRKEKIVVATSRIAQKPLFAVARRADKEMMTTEMINSGWWG